MRRLSKFLIVAVIALLLVVTYQASYAWSITRGEFTAKVTKQLGAEVTLHTRRAWAAELQAEGGEAKFNPANTTLRLPGSTNYNSVGVQNYTSASQGIEATVKTLKENGHGYHHIRKRLRANASATEIVRGFGLSQWGTNLELVLAVLSDVKNNRKPNTLAELEAKFISS